MSKDTLVVPGQDHQRRIEDQVGIEEEAEVVVEKEVAGREVVEAVEKEGQEIVEKEVSVHLFCFKIKSGFISWTN